MASNEERLEDVRRRLTPAVREAIEKAIALDRLPAPLRPVIGTPALQFLGVGPRPGLEGLSPTIGNRRAGAPGSELPRMPLAGLEAIVQRTGRPPLLIRNDRVVLDELPDFPAGTDELIRGIEPAIPAVGRIEFLNHSMAWGGTGWVVEESRGARLVITNRHVAALVAKRKADGRAIFMRGPYGHPYGASIDFKRRIGARTDPAQHG